MPEEVLQFDGHLTLELINRMQCGFSANSINALCNKSFAISALKFLAISLYGYAYGNIDLNENTKISASF
jgi:hypothetical protein